jgi:hypothetical protein
MVKDSVSGLPLAFATISVYTSADTVLQAYRLSGSDGKFIVPNLPLGKRMRMLITYSGYKTIRIEFMISTEEKIKNFDSIKLSPRVLQLEEVLIQAEIPPVIVRKDTIEFNAGSFRYLPDAIIEDLFKKLPGFIIDENGNIKVNGKPVSRILVDGKEFFGSDPKLASKNLPASIVDKVQVTNDKDQMELNPFMPLDLSAQVINLKLKRVVKKTWFGKLSAGKGGSGLYETSGIINHFRDTLQVSILGFANNVNKAAFGYSDLTGLGGFRRSGISNINFGESGSVSINNISFGGTGNGIQSSSGTGININHDPTKNLALNFQYFFGSATNIISEYTTRDQEYGADQLKIITNKSTHLPVYSHRFGFGVKYRINDRERIEFRPNLVISNQNNFDASTTTSFYNNLLQINNSELRNSIPSHDLTYSHSLLFSKTYKKAGRSFSFINSVSLGSADIDQTSIGIDSVFKPSIFVDTLSQLRSRIQKSDVYSVSANYFEPLNKYITIKVSYSGTYSDGKDNLLSYKTDYVTNKPMVIIPSLSNYLSREVWRHNPSATFNWRKNNISASVGLGFVQLDIFNRFNNGNIPINQHFGYPLPLASFGWNKINFNYSTAVIPPSVNDIQPVPDNTNPLYLINGNPNLTPTYVHTGSINYYSNNKKKMLTYNVYLTSSYKDNIIARSRNINSDGKQIIDPFNHSGIYDFTALGSVDKQIRIGKQWMISFRATFSYILGNAYVSVNSHNSYATRTELFPIGQIRMNWNDIIELLVSANRSDIYVTYNDSYFAKQKIAIFRSYNELVLRWPKNIVWDWNFTFRQNNSELNDYNTALLNGGVTFIPPKSPKFHFRLSGYDLLDRNALISSSVSENILINSRTLNLRRYGMITISYDIIGAAATKIGLKERLLLF